MQPHSQPLQPEECKPGDVVAADLVRNWPRMSDKAAVAFRRWTGNRLRSEHRLVRCNTSGRIFEVGSGDIARCVWMTDRKFE